MRVREVTLNEVQELREVAARSFEQAYASKTNTEDMNKYLQAYFNEDTVRTDILNEHIRFFLFCEKDVVLGYCKLRKDRQPSSFRGITYYEDTNFDSALELERIYFLQEYTGKGYGGEALSFVEQFAREEGYEQLFLSVWEENPRALNFYKRLGYRVVAKYCYPFGEMTEPQDFVLVKEL